MNIASTIPGVVIGLVTNNKDPMDMGRIQVKFPWMSDDLASDWFRMATPMSGQGRGFMFLPEIDDEVLVAFEHGDPQRGFIIGSLWNGSDNTPMSVNDALGGGGVRRRRIQSRIGHIIELDDDGMILIQTAQGQVLEMEDNQGIRISTADGQQLYMSNRGEIAMKTSQGRMIHATDIAGGVQIHDGTGNIVDIDSNSGSINITANATVNVKANGMVNVQASGVLSITGSMVNINSGGNAQSASKKSNDDPLGGKGSKKVDLPKK